MVRKTKFWVILFALIFALGLGGFLLLWNLGGSGAATARIWLDGELYEEIELSAVVLPREFDITTELGTNRVRVERGAISVVSADCPDQTCVKMGALRSRALPIVCLPHHLTIRVVDGAEDGGLDAVAR